MTESLTNAPSEEMHRQRKLFDFQYIRQERRQAYILACILFWSILAFLFISRFIFAAVEVVGPSMEPALMQGERHVLHRWIYRVHEPLRGDIVAFDRNGDHDLTVKRIIGLPGETIQLTIAGPAVNGRILEEPYLPSGVVTTPSRYGDAPMTLGADEYFVLGDNRENSEDSRFNGPIPRDALLGQIFH